jgi:hypothetical protein
MQHAWTKYGADAFVFTVIETCAPAQLIEREQFYLDTLRPYDRVIGFNNAHCADVPSRGLKHGPISDEKRAKLSEAARHRPPPSDEARANLRAARAAHPPISDAGRQKMRESHKRRPPISDATRAKMRAVQKGHTYSDEARKKMSAAAKNRPPRSEESRKKTSNILRAQHEAGRTVTYKPRHVVTTPEGEEVLVNMTAFVREHGFPYNAVVHALRAGTKYKGYAIRRIAD